MIQRCLDATWTRLRHLTLVSSQFSLVRCSTSSFISFWWSSSLSTSTSSATSAGIPRYFWASSAMVSAKERYWLVTPIASIVFNSLNSWEQRLRLDNQGRLSRCLWVFQQSHLAGPQPFRPQHHVQNRPRLQPHQQLEVFNRLGCKEV